jgi:hypothetical protein
MVKFEVSAVKEKSAGLLRHLSDIKLAGARPVQVKQELGKGNDPAGADDGE